MVDIAWLLRGSSEEQFAGEVPHAQEKRPKNSGLGIAVICHNLHTLLIKVDGIAVSQVS